MSEEAREVYELFQGVLLQVDAQFQFWLSITFAVVAAAFLARDHLGRALRIAMAALYVASVALTLLKTAMYYLTGLTFMEILLDLGEVPAGSSWGRPILVLRFVIMLLGTAAALVFLLVPGLTSQSPPADGRDDAPR